MHVCPLTGALEPFQQMIATINACENGQVIAVRWLNQRITYGQAAVARLNEHLKFIRMLNQRLHPLTDRRQAKRMSVTVLMALIPEHSR